MKYLDDLYLRLLFRIGVACLPVIYLCLNNPVLHIVAWIATTVMISGITTGVLRLISLIWFDKPVCHQSRLRDLVDGLLALPYCSLLGSLIYFDGNGDNLTVWGIPLYFTIAEIVSFILDVPDDKLKNHEISQ